MATYRQILAAKNLVENGGNAYKAMLAAGYSPATAKTAKKLTESKGFTELIDVTASEQEMAVEIRNLLYASKIDHYVFPLAMPDGEIQELIESIAGCKLRKIKHLDTQTIAYFTMPDNRSKKEALDMLLKVRGLYSAEKIKVEDPNEKLSDEELDARIKELEDAKKHSV